MYLPHSGTVLTKVHPYLCTTYPLLKIEAIKGFLAQLENAKKGLSK